MGAIGKALGFPGLDSPSPKGMESGDGMAEPDEGMPSSEKSEKPMDDGGNPAEVLAMKQFERASTPQAKASALKSFLEACGCSMDSGESY